MERAGKRSLDVTLALLVGLLLTPLMLIVAVSLKMTTTDPVIFKQRRRGLGRCEFVIFKFRTMRVAEDGEVTQARPNNPRVTPLGRLLRASSIDELPQLWNVVRGEMSLVGPRPHALSHDTQYEQVITRYATRHLVKPGITGWAQVNGLRGSTLMTDSMTRRVDFDLWYVDNWSLLLDLRILARTAFQILACDAF